MKDELGGKILTEFTVFRPKTYSMDDGKKDKKAQGTKNCLMKKNLHLMIIKIAY